MPNQRDVAEGRTEAQIRLDLKLAEEEEARKAGTPLHGTSATAFLVAGIQLENTQYVRVNGL
jgi:hypothetical protein